MDQRLPEPNIGGKLGAARHELARMLAEVVNVAVRQNIVEQNSLSSFGRNRDTVVVVSVDCSRESSVTALEVLIEINQERGKSQGLVSVSYGSIHKIVMSRILLIFLVLNNLKRFCQSMVPCVYRLAIIAGWWTSEQRILNLKYATGTTIDFIH